jgi:hypothetical protein
VNRRGDIGDLLIQAKITNRLLAAQLRGTMKQKELVGCWSRPAGRMPRSRAC